MPTIKQLETALVNADRAGDEQAARALAAEIKRMRAQGAKPAAKREQPGRAAAFAKGALSGAADVLLAPVEYAFKGLNALGVPGTENIVRRGEQDVARTNAALAPYRQSRPNAFAAGELVGQTAASAPFISAGGAGISRLGGAVATKAPGAGRVIQRVGKAVQTGGIGSGRTAAETAKLSRATRAGQLAERMAGGAIAGGAGAGLTGQDVGEGAAFGAGLPIVGSIVKRVAGFAGDITKLPRRKAAEIIRKSLEDNVDKAREVFSKLSPNDRRLAEQVLIDAGIEPRTFFGIGKVAQEQIAPTPFAQTLEEQARVRGQRLAQAAGGSTATERRAGAELARQEVSAATGPARNAALTRANIAGEVVPAAEVLADAARRSADEMTASGLVPRMRGLEERAAEQAGVMADNPAYFPDMELIQKTRGIAGAAGQRADTSIAQQIRLRDQARDMEDIVANLAAEGMEPLKVAPIVGQLRSMAAAPGTRADKLQRSTLTRLANELEGLADANGVIDARDLYQIRKTGINDIVDRLLGSRAQPSSGTKERTASLLTSIRPLIDDAIEGAGGQGWKDYLSRTRQGFEAVNRRELAAKGAQLADENAPEFIKLMEGQRPKIVEDIMGPGTRQYDIAGMALADPNRYLALKQSADELSTLNRMAELRGEGAGAAGNLMIKERPSMLTRGLTAATMSSIPSLRIGAQGAEQVERALMTPRVQKEIGNAFLSGQNMADLINTYPTQARISEGVSNLSPMARNVLAQMLRGYMTNPNY